MIYLPIEAGDCIRIDPHTPPKKIPFIKQRKYHQTEIKYLPEGFEAFEMTNPNECNHRMWKYACKQEFIEVQKPDVSTVDLYK